MGKRKWTFTLLFSQTFLVSLPASYKLILGYGIESQSHRPTRFVLQCCTWWKTKSMSTTIFATLKGPWREIVSTQICHLLEFSETILLVSLLQNLSRNLSSNASRRESSRYGGGLESASLLTRCCPLEWSLQNQAFALIIRFWTYGCRIHHSPLITCTSYRFMMINTLTRPCAMTSRDIIVIIIIIV